MKHKKLPIVKYFGDLEQVFAFYGPMPTGVTVSEEGRIFVNFPRWGDDVKFTVAEIVKNKLLPYPNMKVNKEDYNNLSKNFISVQSVVADGRGTLFVLDTASPMFSKPLKGGAKLVAIDLKTNKIRRTYIFHEDVVLPTTYLNDIRVDYRVGEEGYAYITDSSTKGMGGIIVLDLKSGKAFRRLDGDKSTSPDPNFIPKVEGEVFLKREKNGTTESINFAVDGIAISPDGEILYYCPLSSRNLYYIETEFLRNRAIPDKLLSSCVKDLGEKGASDGLMSDANGTVYASDYENNSIRTILPNGTMKTIAHDPRILWPDTLSIGPDKYLYFIANQLNRQANYHYGKDLREKPYSLFRIKINKLPAPTK